jgi:small-conductance mechanosensitive channel
MITDLQSAAEPPSPAIARLPTESTSFDERWAAWEAKGAAHDRVVRRKIAIAAPILLVVAGVVAYVLVGR